MKSLTVGSDREPGVDIARAIAVIGVVFNHVMDGLISGDLVSPGSTAAHINSIMYQFRLPALVFFIGLFIPKGVVRSTGTEYIRRRVPLLIYLYLLWFFLQTSVEVLASPVKNHPRPVWRLLEPWFTFNQLWFLPFMALLTIVVTLSSPWRSKSRAIAMLALGLGLSALTWGWNPGVVGMSGWSLIVFGVAGSILGIDRLLWLLRTLHPALWLLMAVLCALLVVAGVVAGGAHPASTGAQAVSGRTFAVSLISSGSGCVLLISMGALLGTTSGSAARMLTTIGRHTLPIFVAHVIFAAATRIGLGSIGVTNGWAVGSLSLLVGVVAPLGVYFMTRNHPILSGLFDFPLARKRAARRLT